MGTTITQSIAKGIFITFIVILALVLIGVFFAVILTILWNWLMPDIFGLPTIDYWQAYGLWILSSFLLKSINISTK